MRGIADDELVWPSDDRVVRINEVRIDHSLKSTHQLVDLIIIIVWSDKFHIVSALCPLSNCNVQHVINRLDVEVDVDVVQLCLINLISDIVLELAVTLVARLIKVSIHVACFTNSIPSVVVLGTTLDYSI